MTSRCRVDRILGLANDEDPGKPAGQPGSDCALGGIRTPNLLIRSQMLYPLSYERWAGTAGYRSDRTL
jgi:hypothetical protein